MNKQNAGALMFFGILALFVWPMIGLVLLFAGVVVALRLKPGISDAYGSARLATFRDAAKGGLLEREGLILGRTDLISSRRREQSRLLRIQRHVHMATIAPTGRGKGVSVIIPNLLAYLRSVVITDIKGENFRLTAGWRQHSLGQRIFRYDPFEICGPGGDQLNPLDFIDDQAEDFLDQCRDLANMLIVRQGTETDPHWNDSAEKVVTAFLAFVAACAQPEDRNLQTLRMILASPERFARAVETMRQIPTHGGVIARLGDQVSWFKDKELSSVLTTVQRHTEFLDSPPIARFTASTSLDPKRLRADQPATLYICLPHERLDSLAGLNRMIIGTLIRVLARGTPTEHNPVLFVLDEVAQLGRMQALEQAATLMRGMGIRLWFFWQSLAQVKACYGDQADVILDNIDTKQYFGINSYETAEAISKQAGETTVLATARNESTSQSQPQDRAFTPRQPGSTSRSLSVTASEIGRRLLRPEEVLTLPEDVALIFHRNLPAIPASLIRYYDAPEFAAYQRRSRSSASHAAALGPTRRRVRLPRIRTMAALATLSLGVLLLLASAYPPATAYLRHVEARVHALLSPPRDARPATGDTEPTSLTRRVGPKNAHSSVFRRSKS